MSRKHPHSAEAPSSLDRKDRQILRLLQADGRITNQNLAERVGLSPPACLERVRNLTARGYIRGYHAELNPELLDAAMLVFVQVLLDRTTPDVFSNFNAAVRTRDEVQECHLVAGGFDYLVKARVKDMRAYREFIASALWSLPGVRETHTYAVMEEVKMSSAIPVR
jgi:Lrp/AsnC family leucine-responsive transcriptional regulator